MHHLAIMKKLIAGILTSVFCVGALSACYVESHPYPYYHAYHRGYYYPRAYYYY
jgi:hypothetical protein